jgi:hypothetical protein
MGCELQNHFYISSPARFPTLQTPQIFFFHALRNVQMGHSHSWQIDFATSVPLPFFFFKDSRPDFVLGFRSRSHE